MQRKNICILVLLLLLCWLPCIASAAEAQPTAPAGYRLIRIEQWQELKAKSNLLAAKLQLAQDMLTQLEAPSGELMSSLIEARAQLKISQQELQQCKISLENARSSMMKSEQLYNVLMKRIERERKQAAKDRQAAYRKGWLNGFCVGLAGTAVICIIK